MTKMNTIKRLTLPGTIKFYGTDIDVMIPEIYEEKEAEVRAVWVSTVANIDVPKMAEVNDEEIKKYKEYLNKIIDTVKEDNMNTVVFQVRPVGDALYESELNPWSSVLTGVEGKYPGFDVFGYFCEIAKKANVKVHAWINPYRAGRVDIVEANMTKEELLEVGINQSNEHTDFMIGDKNIIITAINEETGDKIEIVKNDNFLL